MKFSRRFTTHIYQCAACGCFEIEGTGWVDLNTGKDTGGDPPTDQFWCPRCEDDAAEIAFTEVSVWLDGAGSVKVERTGGQEQVTLASWGPTREHADGTICDGVYE